MQRLEIELTETEKLVLEFRTFEHQGLQINMNQFLSGNFEFNEEQYDRLIKTILEKYTARQQCIFSILKAHGYKDILAKEYEYSIIEGVLILSV